MDVFQFMQIAGFALAFFMAGTLSAKENNRQVALAIINLR